MKKKTLTAMQNWVWALLAIITVASFFFGNSRSQLAVSYLSQTNQAGHAMAFFTISNAGNVGTACYRLSTLEILGQSQKEQVECETTQFQLAPGEHEVATIYLPRKMIQPWRITFYGAQTADTAPRPASGQAVTSDWIY